MAFGTPVDTATTASPAVSLVAVVLGFYALLLALAVIGYLFPPAALVVGGLGIILAVVFALSFWFHSQTTLFHKCLGMAPFTAGLLVILTVFFPPTMLVSLPLVLYTGHLLLAGKCKLD